MREKVIIWCLAASTTIVSRSVLKNLFVVLFIFLFCLKTLLMKKFFVFPPKFFIQGRLSCQLSCIIMLLACMLNMPKESSKEKKLTFVKTVTLVHTSAYLQQIFCFSLVEKFGTGDRQGECEYYLNIL